MAARLVSALGLHEVEGKTVADSNAYLMVLYHSWAEGGSDDLFAVGSHILRGCNLHTY